MRLTLPPWAQPQRKAGANREHGGAFDSRFPFFWTFFMVHGGWHRARRAGTREEKRGILAYWKFDENQRLFALYRLVAAP